MAGFNCDLTHRLGIMLVSSEGVLHSASVVDAADETALSLPEHRNSGVSISAGNLLCD